MMLESLDISLFWLTDKQHEHKYTLSLSPSLSKAGRVIPAHLRWSQPWQSPSQKTASLPVQCSSASKIGSSQTIQSALLLLPPLDFLFGGEEVWSFLLSLQSGFDMSNVQNNAHHLSQMYWIHEDNAYYYKIFSKNEWKDLEANISRSYLSANSATQRGRPSHNSKKIYFI